MTTLSICNLFFFDQVNVMSQLFETVTDTRYFESPPPSPHQQLSLPLRYDPILASFCSSRRLSEHLNSLILYSLIYHNRTFRIFCLSRTETQYLVLPILKILHDIPGGASQPDSSTTHPPPQTLTHPPCFPIPPAATLLLLVLLILSRDENFSASLFSTVSRIKT